MYTLVSHAIAKSDFDSFFTSFPYPSLHSLDE